MGNVCGYYYDVVHKVKHHSIDIPQPSSFKTIELKCYAIYLMSRVLVSVNFFTLICLNLSSLRVMHGKRQWTTKLYLLIILWPTRRCKLEISMTFSSLNNQWTEKREDMSFLFLLVRIVFKSQQHVSASNASIIIRSHWTMSPAIWRNWKKRRRDISLLQSR